MSVLLKVKNHASISQQKVFWKNQIFFSLFGSGKLVITIVIVLVVMTVLIVGTVLAIMTMLAIVAIVTIVIIVAIKTIIYFSRNEPNIKCKEIVLVLSLASITNVKIVKTVTSPLSCLFWI